ncbi:nuclear transport factor 2 family protein [Sphingomonas sp. 1P06PA]|uniref:nuclear transport factor 2 family protein n=1 Tax=Sphingomonas sp. 1P06PA TaxID=554121 RepID=UPI0039A6B234
MTSELFTAEDRARLNRLTDEAELRAMLADVAARIDWLDWPGLAALFWPDAQFDFGMFKGDLAAYLEFVRTLEEGYRRRMHLFGMPTIRIDGARARLDAPSIIVCRTDNGGGGIEDVFTGRYVLSAERRGTEWRFASLDYLMNSIDRWDRETDDRTAPMNFFEGFGPDHPLA